MLLILKTRQKILSYIAIFLISASVGIYFRLYPITKIPYQRSRAISYFALLTNLRKAVQNTVNLNYPRSTKREKDKLIAEQLANILKKDKKKVQRYIDQLTKGNLSLYKPYLLGADSYYYYYLNPHR